MAVINEFHAKHPIPAIGKSGTRRWMEALVKTIAARFPGQGWGLKKSAEGHPVSGDVLARQGPHGLEGWDLIVGAGSASPKLATNPAHHWLTGQVFIPVTPEDLMDATLDLGGGTFEPEPGGGTGGSGSEILGIIEDRVRRAFDHAEDPDNVLADERIEEHAVQAIRFASEYALRVARANPPKHRRGSGKGGGTDVTQHTDVEVEGFTETE
jgi:hypothetical protein